MRKIGIIVDIYESVIMVSEYFVFFIIVFSLFGVLKIYRNELVLILC